MRRAVLFGGMRPFAGARARDALAGFGVLLIDMPHPRADDATFTAPNFACDYFTGPQAPVASLESGWIRVRGATSGRIDVEL